MFKKSFLRSWEGNKRVICQIVSHPSKFPQIISRACLTKSIRLMGKILGYSCIVQCKLIIQVINTKVKKADTLSLVWKYHHNINKFDTWLISTRWKVFTCFLCNFSLCRRSLHSCLFD